MIDAFGRTTSVHNIEAEAALLGALLIDNSVHEHVAQLVGPDDFCEPVHARIAHAIWRKIEKGQIVTPVTLKPLFDRDAALQELGGITYLARLTADGQGLLAPRELAEQLAELARVRDLQFGVTDMVDAYLDGQDFSQATAYVEDALAKAHKVTTPIETHTAADMIGLVLDRAERLTTEALDENLGVRTSTVSDLNALLGPMEDGTYIVIGGRPSMGKTTLASSAAWGFAANGFPTYYASAESTEEHLAMRFAADLSLESPLPITHDAIRKDKLTAQERQHFNNLGERAATLPIDYQLVGRCDVRTLRLHVARAAAKWRDRGQRLRVVVVDYLQLLEATENGREITDDRRKVNAVSKGLLGIAKDFGVVLIALSQLSRSLEQREDKRPKLSDLRESGRIEEDADAVLFVYREEYYLERSKPEPGRKDFESALLDWQADLARCRDRVELLLAKNRHGEVRSRTSKFLGKYTAIRGGDFEVPLDDALPF